MLQSLLPSLGTSWVCGDSGLRSWGFLQHLCGREREPHAGGTPVPMWGEAAPHTLMQHRGWCGLGQQPLGHVDRHRPQAVLGASPQGAWQHGNWSWRYPGAVAHLCNPRAPMASGQGRKGRPMLAVNAFPAFSCATSPGSSAGHLDEPPPLAQLEYSGEAGGALIPVKSFQSLCDVKTTDVDGGDTCTGCPQHKPVQPLGPSAPRGAQESSQGPSLSVPSPGKSLAFCVFSRHRSSILWPEANPKHGLSC